MPHTGFQIPAKEPNLLERIGTGLQGFGAGVRGGGTEFLAGQRAEQRQLSLERQQAAAEDLQRARLLLDSGDLTGVRDLAQQRVDTILQIGGDPSDTMALLNLTEGVLGGDSLSLDRLNTEINEGLRIASEQGLISLPAPPQRQIMQDVAGMQRFVDTGERVFPEAIPAAAPVSARETKIDDIMETFSLDRATAVAVADNKIEVIPGTAPGEFSLASSIPGFSVEQAITGGQPPGAQPPQPERPRTDITGGLDVAELGTGLLDAIIAIFGRIPGVGEGVGVDQRKANVILSALSTSFQTAFANNPRFAEAEREFILSLIGPARGPISTKSSFLADLTAARGFINNKVEESRVDAANRSLFENIREDAQREQVFGERFLRQIDQIINAAKSQIPTITTPQEFEDLDAGSLYINTQGQTARKPQ